MGQTGSAQLETMPEPVKAQPLPVKKVPPPRPSSPPKRPRSPSKGPKYAKPENRVLPLGDLTPRKLRPISQEISKVKYPEFADLFHGRELDADIENEEAMDISEDDSKDNAYYKAVYAPEEDTELPDNGMRDNADVHRHANGVLANGTSHMDRSSSEEDTDTERSGLRRTHSLDRAPVRPKGHRRQPSRTTSLMNEEHTIFEDPRESLAENREHLYDNWRKDPYMNNPSNVVSLPVRSNFDLDVKLNMTYAQLAEHRRQKNLEELKKKTGISVESLHSDLTENSNIPFNPFQRQASRESTRSTSTASSDTGVSKKKKKRAPPPPGSKVEGAVDEPPIDYDIDDPVPTEKPYQRRSSIISNASILSSKSKPAPAPPKVIPLPEPAVSKVEQTPSPILPQASSTPLPEESSLPIPPPPPPVPESKEKVNQAQDAIKKLDRLLSEENSKEKNMEMKQESEPISPTVSSPESRLSSLVSSQSESEEDPDRVRILKPKIPPLVVEKEKDESQLFREKLQMAYEARTKRHEEELKRKEDAERKLREKQEAEAKMKEEEGSISARSEKKHGESVEILRRLSRDLDKKWLSAHKAQSPVTSAHETDDDLSSRESKSSGQQRVFASNWTPEDDLDSDDDIEDRKTVYSHQRNTSEGFKSSILPTKFNELKKNSKGKYIRKQDSTNDDKQKYGSIRKLKKTVNKSVRNAFGSLSRASGKLLRKQRSMDLDEDLPPPPPPPSNWHLSSSTHQLNGDTQHIERRLSQGNILTSDEESSESDSEEVMPQPPPIPNYQERQRQELNGQIRGYAASMQNGRLNGTVEAEDTSRLYKKKKKKGGHIANGKQPEVYQIDPMTEKIKQTQRQIETEKQRQQEIEREMLRLKALEQEERFQRMQTAHFHQQLQVLQQSVAPGQSQITAPPLPPAGGLHSYSVPDFNHPQHAYPHMMNQGLPQGPMSPGMSFNNGNNGLTSFDINYLSNLMRMNGVQPPSSPQQWAYLLNSVSLPTQPLQTKAFYQTPEVPQHARQVKSMYVTTTPAPDLTTMFTGQSFDDSQIRSHKKSMMGYISGKKQSKSFSNLTDGPTEPIRMDSLLHDYEKSAGLLSQTEKTKQRANPMYYSSDEEDLTSGLSPARTSRNYVASVQVKDYRPIPHLQPGMTDVDANGQMYSPYHVQSAPTHRQRTPGEDSSSSGADR